MYPILEAPERVFKLVMTQTETRATDLPICAIKLKKIFQKLTFSTKSKTSFLTDLFLVRRKQDEIFL